MDYNEYAEVFKALSDKIRVEIVEMLKGGCLCACKILEKFNISQPTLSYHMKILTESGIVSCRKEGIWNHYSVNKEQIEKINSFLKF